MEGPNIRGRRRPVLFHGAMALALTAILTVGLWFAFGGRWTWLPWLAAWLVAVNGTTFVYYGFDKFQARREGAGRVPEVVLHALAIVGGSVGTVAGMRLFRHKTVKGSFRFVFWLIVIAQILLMVGVAYRMFVARPS
jgi:uncharacterized membrane protein YsdA (DUF1294 family)